MLVFLLLRVEVAHGGAAGDASGGTDGARVCEQRLGQGRLAGTAMPYQGHIADVVGGVCGHVRDPPSSVVVAIVRDRAV